MKKHLFPIVFAACALLTACNTPRKLYEAKAYDEVIMDGGGGGAGDGRGRR